MKTHGLTSIAVILIMGFALSSCNPKTDGAPATTTPTVDVEATPTQMVANKPNPHYVEGGIKWMTFEEAIQANQSEKRKIFIDVYTDWCGWCKVMDKKTFTDETVINYMNEHYYAVKFNAEKEDPVVFQGKNFELVDGGRRPIHTLAYAMLDGKLSYPSYVYFNENNQRITISKGFKDPVRFLKELENIEMNSAGI